MMKFQQAVWLLRWLNLCKHFSLCRIRILYFRTGCNSFCILHIQWETSCECRTGVPYLKSRNSNSSMVLTVSIALSTCTYVVFCIAVYGKKLMLWSVCKHYQLMLPTAAVTLKLGFCAFKLTVIAIYQSFFLHWNSILGNCYTVYNQNPHIDLLLK